MTTIIKGCPRDKWEAVQAVQHSPFIYIQGNGSKWAGDEADDVPVLLYMLAKHPLDAATFGPNFWTDNPCEGVINPEWGYDNDKPHWIDGERLYACDGVVRFFGNFLTWSHGFTIDTNDADTISALKGAIRDNLQRYSSAGVSCCAA